MALRDTKNSTTRINRRSAEAALHAVRYAGEGGRDINTHVTINFTQLNIDACQAPKLFKDLKTRLRRAWDYERKTHNPGLGPMTGVHVFESPSGNTHAHWAVHVPDAFYEKFAEDVEDRLQKLTGYKDLGTALHIDGVSTPGNLMKYLMKGVDPAFQNYFHLPESSDQGRVYGRRIGVSRDIGKASRERAGWKRKRSASR